MTIPPEREAAKQKIFIAGGGTGGHLYPGLALANALRELSPEISITFIGTAHGLDEKLVPEAGYKLVKLAAGRGSPINIRKPGNFFRFIKSLLQCRKLFLKERPDVVVGLGGFAAAPAGMMARWFKIPLVLLEQNVIPGRVNKQLSRWASEIHLQFDESRQYLPHARGKLFHSGSPIRNEITELFKNETGEKNNLLVMGGSQGAQRLNELVCECAPGWAKAGISVIHLTGQNYYDEVSKAYAGLDDSRIKAIKYASEMPSLYRQTRLALVRAGATTIAELAITGIPAIFIPFPAARDDHQTVNARTMEQSGAAVLQPEGSLTPRDLRAKVLSLWKDEAKLKEMSRAMRSFAKPDAAREIASRIISMKQR